MPEWRKQEGKGTDEIDQEAPSVNPGEKQREWRRIEYEDVMTWDDLRIDKNPESFKIHEVQQELKTRGLGG